jgi:hypothetical protein
MLWSGSAGIFSCNLWASGDLYTVLRLFFIRFKIWDDEPLSAQEMLLWEAARSDFGNWALFHRLVLSADDRDAREQVEQDVEKGLDEFFRDADQVEFEDRGNGLQKFSATFDLTKKPI